MVWSRATERSEGVSYFGNMKCVLKEMAVGLG
jgi:hypothetical protein